MILAAYCLVLTQFGLENFDTGYIPSFAWRIVNGQTVYQDFIYKGPPVTLYFHAIFMYCLPETAQFFFIRIINYLLFALQVYLVVDAFYHSYDLRKFQKWGLVTIGFMVSILAFSPYPWPTTDGLLFASVAFWLVSKSKDPGFWKLFTIALFCMLSALTKQSFYLIPILFLLWIFVQHSYRKAIVFMVQIIALSGIYLSLIVSATSFKNFISQTTGETHWHDLFYTGLHNYIFISVKAFAVLLAIFLALAFGYLKLTKRKPSVLLPFFKWTAVFVFSVAIALCCFKKIELASRIAFDAALIALIYGIGFKVENLRKYFPVAVSLGIAWSSSISLGYQFPVLFSTAIVLGFIVLIEKNLKMHPQYYLWIAVPVCITAFSYNLKPYREPNIFDLKYPLESISSKLKFIKTSKSNFEKYSELKQLVAKYGENFIVAPNIPMANYLFNDQSELPADWIIETEVGRRQNLFIRLASEKKNYIFLEKSFLQHEEFMPEDKEKFSSIAAFIYKNFNQIDQTSHFLVYNALKPQ